MFVKIGTKYYNFKNTFVIDDDTVEGYTADEVVALLKEESDQVRYLKWLVRSSFEEGYRRSNDAPWNEVWEISRTKERLG